MFDRRSRKAKASVTAEIGRLTKIENLPPDIISDWRRFCSSRGPMMKARTRGIRDAAPKDMKPMPGADRLPSPRPDAPR